MMGVGILSYISSGCRSAFLSYIILCAGDSLTEKGYPNYLRRFLRQQGYLVKIYNYGRSGHNSAEYLAYLKRNESFLKSLKPDFILVELGTNDVRLDGDQTPLESFEKNMAEIIRIFSEFTTRQGERSRIFLALIPPIPSGVEYPFGLESARRVEVEINPALLKLARENNLPLVDHWNLFRSRPELLPNVHPSQDGYREMAKAWMTLLLPHLLKPKN
ncbi:MAG: SGNH/GDSL hydrolase family protein [Candidatus Aminicenantes bacterium]|nr:SGNH/GDSL hydrolase family protein [Candidatus Aminicenantes bacterium]